MHLPNLTEVTFNGVQGTTKPLNPLLTTVSPSKEDPALKVPLPHKGAWTVWGGPRVRGRAPLKAYVITGG